MDCPIKKEGPAGWDTAHYSQPRLWRSPSGYLWGILGLAEDRPAVLPLVPSIAAEEPVVCWQLSFSANTREVVGSMDYFLALERLRPFVLDEKHGSLLVRGISRQEWNDRVRGFRWWEEYAGLDLCGGRLEPISEHGEDMLEIIYPDGGLIDVSCFPEKKMYRITAVSSDDEKGWRSPLFSVDVEGKGSLSRELQAAIRKFRQ